MAHDVFVSYSNQDKPTADAIVASLEANGIRCWVAPRDILPGADWGASIVEAIEKSGAMVLVFSGHANTSGQIKREVDQAVTAGIPIIPFRIEEVLPNKELRYYLSTPHWLDAWTLPLEQHLHKLIDSIKALLSERLEGFDAARREPGLKSSPEAAVVSPAPGAAEQPPAAEAPPAAAARPEAATEHAPPHIESGQAQKTRPPEEVSKQEQPRVITDEEIEGRRLTESILIKNPKTGEVKTLEVGWSFTAFLSNFMIGFVTLIFVIVDIDHQLKIQSFVFAFFFSIAMGIIFSIIANRYIAKKYLKKGWIFVDPESKSVKIAKLKWGIDK